MMRRTRSRPHPLATARPGRHIRSRLNARTLPEGLRRSGAHRLDLGAVLAQVCDDESFHTTQREVALQIAPHAGSLVVTGQSEELRRLLANLVSNAVKYSSAGSSVDLLLERGRGEVIFTCADHGLGISREDQQQLFTEFFRSTNPEAVQRPGTGLGLAIVARIAARHGGQIHVESELGVGTTIRVRFPSGNSDRPAESAAPMAMSEQTVHVPARSPRASAS